MGYKGEGFTGITMKDICTIIKGNGNRGGRSGILQWYGGMGGKQKTVVDQE